MRILDIDELRKVKDVNDCLSYLVDSGVIVLNPQGNMFQKRTGKRFSLAKDPPDYLMVRLNNKLYRVIWNLVPVEEPKNRTASEKVNFLMGFLQSGSSSIPKWLRQTEKIEDGQHQHGG